MVLTNVDDGHIRRIIGHKLFFRGQANKRGGGGGGEGGGGG